jgi:hypothetical protein
VVDLDAVLGQQLLDIAVGQPVAQVPAHRDRDHLSRERYPAGGDDTADFRLNTGSVSVTATGHG